MRKITLMLLLISNVCFAQLVTIPFDKDNFYFNSLDVHRMDAVIDSLRENPSWKVSIHGHAHHREGNFSPTQQMNLSRMRANVVKAYFISYYIQESRIVDCIGFGTDRPVDRKIPHLNWRTELFLIKE